MTVKDSKAFASGFRTFLERFDGVRASVFDALLTLENDFDRLNKLKSLTLFNLNFFKLE